MKWLTKSTARFYFSRVQNWQRGQMFSYGPACLAVVFSEKGNRQRGIRGQPFIVFVCKWPLGRVYQRQPLCSHQRSTRWATSEGLWPRRARKVLDIKTSTWSHLGLCVRKPPTPTSPPRLYLRFWIGEDMKRARKLTLNSPGRELPRPPLSPHAVLHFQITVNTGHELVKISLP